MSYADFANFAAFGFALGCITLLVFALTGIYYERKNRALERARHHLTSDQSAGVGEPVGGIPGVPAVWASVADADGRDQP